MPSTARLLIAAAVLAGLVTGCASSGDAARDARPTPPGAKNVVLVHGAFADGSSWAKVITRLQERGYHVMAVQHPMTSLEEDVAATRRVLAKQDGPTVLVGHSYGGSVITEAGADPKVVALVYVAAFAPEVGESGADQGKNFPPAPLGQHFVPDPDGMLWISETGVRTAFAQDVTPAEAGVIYATQAPVSGERGFGGVPKAHAWKSKPSYYIVAAQDRAVDPGQQRFLAKRIGATTVELDAGHVPMVSRPADVADVIARAAESARPR